MIISDDEIQKCLKIVVSETGVRRGEVLNASARVYVADVRSRFDAVSYAPNARLEEVKQAINNSHYRIDSDEVAEKMLGRVISDKVR